MYCLATMHGITDGRDDSIMLSSHCIQYNRLKIFFMKLMQ